MKAPRDFFDKSKWISLATTPETVTPLIRALAAKVAPGGEPTYVNVLPGADCKMLACYFNVESATRELPHSQIVHGWVIWECPGIYLLAEHHAVVKLEDGQLMDVTPQMDDCDKVLFVPTGYDEKLQRQLSVPDGRGLRSEFAAIDDHPLVHQFISLKVALDQLQSENLADTRRYNELEGRATNLLNRCINRKQDAAKWHAEKENRKKKKKAERQRKKK